VSLLSDAAAELYAGELETFTQRRAELAGQARAVGDKAGAKSIASLGKPTRAAWVVNRLVRADPSVPDQLAALGDQLRAGEAALDGAHIRELSQRRRQLVDKLVRQALAHSAQPSATAALKEEVTATFNAALADPAVAEQVAAAKLLRPAHWAGFSPGIGTDPGAAPIVGRPPSLVLLVSLALLSLWRPRGLSRGANSSATVNSSESGLGSRPSPQPGGR